MGRLRDAVPYGGLTLEIFDRSVQSRACRLSLRDGACWYRATGRVPIGALPRSRRHHGSDRPSGPVPSTQHVITWEAIHHDEPTAQHLLKHGSSRSARGRPGRGHARRGACRRRGLPAGEDLGERVVSGDGGRLPAAACVGPKEGDGAPGRGGGHRYLRRGPVPLPFGAADPGVRGEPTRPVGPPSAREVGPARRSGRRAGRAEWSRPGAGQNRRRSGAERPDVQNRQGLCGQGQYPGDQPAQGRPGHRRPRTAGTAVQPGQCRAVPHLRAPRPARR